MKSKEKFDKLEQFEKIAVDREPRRIEMKKEADELLKKLG